MSTDDEDTATGTDGDTGTGDQSGADEVPEVRGYAAWQVYLSAAVALVVTALTLRWAASFSVATEELARVSPAAEGPNAGIGTDWIVGNTIPSLDFLIALVHAADVIMGLFILVMVFVHWAAFRRLASRMRQPGESPRETVAADGGAVESQGGDAE